jgi:hypothetical protein
MGSIRQQLYASNSNFNNTSGDIDAFARFELSRHTRLTLKDAFTRAEEPRSFEDTLGRSPGRYSTLRNRLNVELRQELGKQLAVLLRYGNEVNDLSRDTLRDSLLHKAGVQAEYALSSETFLLGAYDFSLRDFNPGQDAAAHTATAGVRQYFTPAVYAEARGGLDVLEDFAGGTVTRPRFQASLNREVDGESLASLTLDQTYETTTYEESVFKSWRASAAYRRQLLKRLSGDVAGFFGQSEYTASTVEDDTAGAGFAFTYELSSDWSAGVSYRLSSVESSDSGREYLRNTVMLTVGVKL